MCGDMLTSEKYKAMSAITQMRKNSTIAVLGMASEDNVPKASQCMQKFAAAHQVSTANDK